jgi:hypothetical protein
MIEQAFKVIERLLFEFSWRRFLSFVLVVLFVFGGFAAFEWYTSYFTISRIQRTATALRSLQEIEKGGLRSQSAEEQTRQQLLLELRRTLYQRHVAVTAGPIELSLSWTAILKFVFGASPWVLVALSAVRAIRKREQNAWYGFGGILLTAGVFGLIGAALPTVGWPWVNLFVYPVGHFVLIIAAFIVLAYKMGKRTERVSPGAA